MLILLGAVIALVIGLAAKFAIDFYNGSGGGQGTDPFGHGYGSYYGRVRRRMPSSISWTEFALGAVICCVIIVPLVWFVGGKVAVSNQLNGYQEHWNGFETQANWDRITCTRDGSCVHEYDCDPYTVLVTKTRSVSDGKGGTRTETYTETETRYHRCPYTDEEWTFTVDSTLGEFTIASHNLPTNPDQHRWRAGTSVPSYESGIPAFWQAAKDRLDAGKPGPVVKRATYSNYILASQTTILNKYSDAVDRYLKAGLLPKPTQQVHSHYLADKVYAVGLTLPNERELQNAVLRLNAALGTELQGDLHFVVANAAKVTNPDEYKGALHAYWQGKELGKAGASKNAIVIVAGTRDGKTIEWVQAFTGMPVGNEQMLEQLRTELAGQPIDGRTLFGEPTARVVGDDVKVTHTDGVVEQVLWGSNKFQRISMSADDADDEGSGYSYLKGEIRPTTGQKAVILIVAGFLCALIWVGFLLLDNAYCENLLRRRRATV